MQTPWTTFRKLYQNSPIMQLTTEVIEMAKAEVAISQYYVEVDEATAKHILFNEFREKTKWKNLPKIIFYILMDKLYKVKKAADGNLGYCVTFKPPRAMRPKIAYIMHRINAATPEGVEANLADLRRIIRRIHLEHPEVIPFCPYYADVVSLNDHEPDERARGLLCGLELLGRGFIEEAWLTGPAISEGMKGEMAACITAHISIEDKIGQL